ncbi:SDR family NAD(P)-dependent oxidoreductase [Paenibacillus sp. JTLBN-2024]
MEHHDQAKAAKKTALVTGGSRGIGRGIALALAQAGYEIMITHYRDDAMAEQTAEEIEKLSGRACRARRRFDGSGRSGGNGGGSGAHDGANRLPDQ